MTTFSHSNERDAPHRKSANWGGRIAKLSLASSLLVLSLPAFAQDGGDPRLRSPVVRTAIAKSASESKRSFTGVVMARVQSNLGFRVDGKITERLVDVGEVVKEGQPLMRLDATDLDLALRAKQNAVTSAKAALSRAQADEQRFSRLLSSGATSHQIYDQAKEAYDTAVAQLDAAVADANFAKNETNYTILNADSDGVVTDTLAEPGQVVSAGQAVLKLAHSGEREASVNLPENVRPKIGSTGTATIYGSDTHEFAARLRQFSNAADPATRTFEARYVLDGGETVPLGSTVKVSIDLQANQVDADAVEVPIGSIWDSGAGTGVWEVKDGKSVQFAPVKVLKVSEESAIVKGVDQGSIIVAVGVNLLNEGMAIRTAKDEVAAK